MSRQQKSIYLPLVGTTLLCLLIGLYLAVWKRFSKPDPSTKVVKHLVKTPPEQTLKYWTEEKMRTARPAPMPHVDAISQEKQPPHSQPGPSSSSNTE